MEDNEEVVLSIAPGYMKNKSHFCGFSKKIENAGKRCFEFSEIVK